MNYADYQHLLIDIAEGIATVTLNRPDVYNATNNRMHWELTQVWRDLDHDPAVRVIVVTGAGDQAFSAGGDISDMGTRGALDAAARYDAMVNLLKEAQTLVYEIVNCEKVIVSAINGVAVGAGLAVALMADISIMAEDARLTDGHLRLGVAAGDHAAMIWPLLCGMAKAKYYLLTSEFIDGREAERIGLVSRAVPRAEVRPTAMALARKLADGPQPALRFTERALNQWLRLGGITALRLLGRRRSHGLLRPRPRRRRPRHHGKARCKLPERQVGDGAGGQGSGGTRHPELSFATCRPPAGYRTKAGAAR